MLSPVAVSWMIGKSLWRYRFGPAATLARHLAGTIQRSSPRLGPARLSIEAMDAWGLDSLHHESSARPDCRRCPRMCCEAAKVDGASGCSRSGTLRPIMPAGERHRPHHQDHLQLSSAGHPYQRTAGGPGGGHRYGCRVSFTGVYRAIGSNVGYGTGSLFYLLLIISFLTVLLRLSRQAGRRKLL